MPWVTNARLPFRASYDATRHPTNEVPAVMKIYTATLYIAGVTSFWLTSKNSPTSSADCGVYGSKPRRRGNGVISSPIEPE